MDGGDSGGDAGHGDAGHGHAGTSHSIHGGTHSAAAHPDGQWFDGANYIGDGGGAVGVPATGANAPRPTTGSYHVDTGKTGSQIPLFSQADYAEGDAIAKIAAQDQSKGFRARVSNFMKEEKWLGKKGLAFAGAVVALGAVAYAVKKLRSEQQQDTSAARS